MSSPDAKIETLVTWARENLPRLRHEPAAVVADQLGDEVLRVDGQLGVEVADDGDGVREIIITAFSEPRLFSLVRRLVVLLSETSGWRFVALKPPRGFAFALSMGNHQIQAKSLEFRSTPEIEGGVQLLAPSAALEAMPAPQAEELAWLVVETGIGEELAGVLRHVEFSGAEGARDRHPIVGLEAYVKGKWASGRL